jgi:hypothetical protein
VIKKVREILYEKFMADSDPIHDMDIGMVKKWKKIAEEVGKMTSTHFEIKYKIKNNINTRNFDIPFIIWKILDLAGLGKDPQTAYQEQARECNLESRKLIANILEKYFFMKVNPNFKGINEKFEEESDPIRDMGIGTKVLIEKWIKKINNSRQVKKRNCDGIRNYEIINGFINVNRFTALPDFCGDFPEYIKFGTIKGDFIISSCGLTTLRGCPHTVTGDFMCAYNKLTSLKYAPKHVKGEFSCENNYISFTNEDVMKVCEVKGGIYT